MIAQQINKYINYSKQLKKPPLNSSMEELKQCKTNEKQIESVLRLN